MSAELLANGGSWGKGGHVYSFVYAGEHTGVLRILLNPGPLRLLWLGSVGGVGRRHKTNQKEGGEKICKVEEW